MDATADAPQAPPLETLYFLCTLYTWLLLGLTVIEFFTGVAAPEHIMSAAYFGFLSAYGGHRELKKWSDPQLEQDEPKRRGEQFVVIWGLLLLFMWIAATYIPSFELGGMRVVLHYPHELPAIVLEVVAVFAGTNVSKTCRATVSKSSLPTAQGEDDEAPTYSEVDLAKHGVMILMPRGQAMTLVEIVALFKDSLRPPHPKTVQRALAALAKEGLVEKIAKGPHDPDTKYRRK